MKFDYLVIGGGHHPPLSFVKRLSERSHYIVTVDRGGLLALKLQAIPFLHVGDGDSFPQKKLKVLKPAVTLTLKTNKDFSDLEFAVREIKSEKAKVIVGAHLDYDGRIDHGFSNLLWLSQTPNTFFADEKMWITCLQNNKALSFKAPSKTPFSVLPLHSPHVHFTISGAKYNLKNKSLSYLTQGMSNETKSSRVTIESTGPALLFVFSDITKTQID